MKKILLAVVLSGLGVAAFGQGQVQFRNYITTTTPNVNAPVYLNQVGGTLLDASNTAWRAALIGGPSTTGTPANVANGFMGTLSMMYNPVTTTLTWVNFRTGTTAPIASGYVNNSAGVPRVVPGVDWGGTALVQMVAWEGDYTTWEAAFTAWQSGVPGVRIGASNPLTLTLPSAATSPTLTYLWGLQSFEIVPVPEPTTFALAGLGAAALLIFRRRN